MTEKNFTRWVISDIHLLDGSKADHSATCALHSFLDEQLQNGDELIQVGDGFDFLLAESWHDVAKAHAEVVRKIVQKTSRYIIVRGNHDPSTNEILCFLESSLDGDRHYNVNQLISDGKILITEVYTSGKYLFLHGHQVDQEIKSHPWLAWAVGKVGGVIMRTVWPAADVWFGKVNAWIQRTGKHGEPENYFYEITNWVKRYFRNTSYFEVCFFGHTHQYGFSTNKDCYPKLIINTGCFVDKGLDHTIIGIKDCGEIKVLHYDDVKLVKTEVITNG